MKPIFNTGDKVYLTEEDDFNDYEIIEVNAVDRNDAESSDDFMYKIKPVKGDRIVTKSETEIFPITG
jgi:hypothetical protein